MTLPKKKDLTPDQKKIYQSLTNAKKRCTNPNDKSYKNYGGRGIEYHLDNNKSQIQVVLEQEQAWRECKRKHPNEVVTINRIDNDGDYTESNIQWVPLSENTKQMHKDNPLITEKALGKPVRCATSGKEYPSTSKAERVLEISNGKISACCLGKRKSAGKYKGKPRVWHYIWEEENVLTQAERNWRIDYAARHTVEKYGHIIERLAKE